MKIATLDDLFLHTLKDMLYAERKFLKALPGMERQASDPKLKAAMARHSEETEEHVMRLEEVFEAMGKPARGAKCDAMIGLVDEAEYLMAGIDDAETKDAALISLAQAVEHYEIARYGTLVALAKQLGKPKLARLLKVTLDEACAANKVLTKLADKRLSMIVAA